MRMLLRLQSESRGPFVIGDDGAELYQSSEHYERRYEQTWPESDHAYWDD
jgi:hypothetical protein